MRALLVLALVAFQANADDADLRPPFITTPDAVVERMLEFAGTRADDVVMDLGSGDGRIVIAAARKFGARGVGIELSPALVEESRRNARLPAWPGGCRSSRATCFRPTYPRRAW